MKKTVDALTKKVGVIKTNVKAVKKVLAKDEKALKADSGYLAKLVKADKKSAKPAT